MCLKGFLGREKKEESKSKGKVLLREEEGVRHPHRPREKKNPKGYWYAH